MRVLLVLVLVVASFAWSPGRSASAAPSVPFAPRFKTNANGEITIVGNNLETCPATAANCAQAQAGTARLNNNSFAMVNQDADTDPTTINSSAATLALPSGASVLWAGLYWGARQSAGNGGTAARGDRRVIRFKVPGGGYTPISSTTEFGPTAGDLAYQEFADVTARVRAAGSGSYWGADVAAGTGEDRYAGWSIVAVIGDPTEPLRDLTVFDGFADVGQGNPQTITVQGFRTPKTGPVDAQVGLVAYEGDYATSGDRATLESTQLGTSVSPGTNFFNGVDDDSGTLVTARTPRDLNMLGFDIKNVGASGVLANDQTSAQLSLVSSGDRYFPGVVTTAINLFAPDFNASTKSVTDLAGNSPALPGDTLRYALTYANTGGDPATGVVLTDPLPAGTTYLPGSLQITAGANAGRKTDAAADDQAEYVAAGRQVRARLGVGASAVSGGTLAPAASTTVTFDVTLDRDSGGSVVTNAATLDYVAATLGDALTYQVRPVSTAVGEIADLSIAKTLTPDPTVIGSDATATMTVRNAGPSTARAVVVTDPLPAGTTFSSANTTQGRCTAGATSVSCALGDLADGASATVTVVTTVSAASTATSLTDVATVDGSTDDPDLENNSAGAGVELTAVANLSVTKTPTVASVTPGGRIGYTVTVRNAGPSVARDVVVSDSVDDPGTLSLDTVAPAAACGGAPRAPVSAIKCTFATLGAGQQATITVSGVTSSSLAAGAPIVNNVSAVSSTPDPDPDDNSATATSTASPPRAALTVTKVAAPTALTAGGEVRYTVTVANDAGPSDATGVVLSDPMPAGLTAVSATSSRGTCTLGATVTCQLGTLVAGDGSDGASATIEIVAQLAADVVPGTVLNTATASGSDAPAMPAQTSTASSAAADLSVRKSGSGSPTDPTAPVIAGQDAYYTITATNSGPSTAHAVSVTDDLVADFPFVSATSTAGVCTESAGTVSCPTGDLAPDAEVTVLVRVQVPPTFTGDPVADVARVASTTADPTTANNSATFETSTGNVADVSVTKTASGDTVVAGGRLTYTLTAANAGPSAATDVIATDTLPAGLSVVTAPGCITNGQQVSCAAGTVAAGDEQAFTIVVAADPDTAPGSELVDRATVTSSTPDPSDANNSEDVSTTARAETDLSISKVASSDSGPAGSPTVFTLVVTNDGPSVARDVMVADHFAADAALAAQDPADACELVQADLQCALGDIEPGGQRTIRVGFFIASYVDEASYVNRATVGSATPDTDATNNVAQVTFTVTAPVADVQLAKAIEDGPLLAGGAFDYQITVTPGGLPDNPTPASDAQDVVVTDNVPVGLTPETVSTTQGSCTITGQRVRCEIGTVPGIVASTQTGPITITVAGTVASGASGSVTNAATLQTSTALTPTSVTEASVSSTVAQRAELTISKTPDESPIIAGSVVTYSVSVSNTGPSDARAATITDPLPPGVTFEAADSDPRCALTAGQVECPLGVIAAGDTVTVLVAGRLDPTFAGDTLSNTASVASPTAPDGPSTTVQTPVARRAVLSLVKESDTATPSVGTAATYSLSLTNSGPSTATEVSVSDTLPDNFDITAVRSESALTTCTVTEGPPARVQCVAASLPVGRTEVVYISVLLPDGLAPGTVVNTATAQAADASPIQAIADVDVSLVADTSVTKTLLTNPIVAGAPVSYRIVVSNAGPSSAPDTTISDTLPAGTSLDSVTLSTGGTCVTTEEGTLTVVDCPLGRVPVGGTTSALLTLHTSGALTGTLANTTYAGSGALDPEPGDNVATAQGSVTHAPPLGGTPSSSAPSTNSAPRGSPTATSAAGAAGASSTVAAVGGASWHAVPNGELGATGVDVAGILGAVSALLLAGALAVFAGRRRRSGPTHG